MGDNKKPGKTIAYVSNSEECLDLIGHLLFYVAAIAFELIVVIAFYNSEDAKITHPPSFFLNATTPGLAVNLIGTAPKIGELLVIGVITICTPLVVISLAQLNIMCFKMQWLEILYNTKYPAIYASVSASIHASAMFTSFAAFLIAFDGRNDNTYFTYVTISAIYKIWVNRIVEENIYHSKHDNEITLDENQKRLLNKTPV